MSNQVVCAENGKVSMVIFLRKACLALLTAVILIGLCNSKATAQTVIKNDSIRPYIHFLETNKFLSAKEYVLSKFETYDIVILS